MIPYQQMSLAQEIFESDKPEFLKLLESTIDLYEMIPVSFLNHFYASTGRPREYKLTSLLWALTIQKIFSIPTDSLLLTFLTYSKDLREFCGFNKIPDASKITRFKQDFKDDLQAFFDSLVDLTEPILQEIDADKASKPKAGMIPLTLIRLPTVPCRHTRQQTRRSNSSILTVISATLIKPGS